MTKFEIKEIIARLRNDLMEVTLSNEYIWGEDAALEKADAIKKMIDFAVEALNKS